MWYRFSAIELIPEINDLLNNNNLPAYERAQSLFNLTTNNPEARNHIISIYPQNPVVLELRRMIAPNQPQPEQDPNIQNVKPIITFTENKETVNINPNTLHNPILDNLPNMQQVQKVITKSAANNRPAYSIRKITVAQNQDEISLAEPEKVRSLLDELKTEFLKFAGVLLLFAPIETLAIDYFKKIEQPFVDIHKMGEGPKPGKGLTKVQNIGKQTAHGFGKAKGLFLFYFDYKIIEQLIGLIKEATALAKKIDPSTMKRELLRGGAPSSDNWEKFADLINKILEILEDASMLFTSLDRTMNGMPAGLQSKIPSGWKTGISKMSSSLGAWILILMGLRKIFTTQNAKDLAAYWSGFGDEQNRAKLEAAIGEKKVEVQDAPFTFAIISLSWDENQDKLPNNKKVFNMVTLIDSVGKINNLKIDQVWQNTLQLLEISNPELSKGAYLPRIIIFKNLKNNKLFSMTFTQPENFENKTLQNTFGPSEMNSLVDFFIKDYKNTFPPYYVTKPGVPANLSTGKPAIPPKRILIDEPIKTKTFYTWLQGHPRTRAYDWMKNPYSTRYVQFYDKIILAIVLNNIKYKFQREVVR